MSYGRVPYRTGNVVEVERGPGQALFVTYFSFFAAICSVIGYISLSLTLFFANRYPRASRQSLLFRQTSPCVHCRLRAHTHVCLPVFPAALVPPVLDAVAAAASAIWQASTKGPPLARVVVVAWFFLLYAARVQCTLGEEDKRKDAESMLRVCQQSGPSRDSTTRQRSPLLWDGSIASSGPAGAGPSTEVFRRDRPGVVSGSGRRRGLQLFLSSRLVRPAAALLTRHRKHIG